MMHKILSPLIFFSFVVQSTGYQTEASRRAPPASSPSISQSSPSTASSHNNTDELDIIWQGVSSSLALPFDTWSYQEGSNNDDWLHGISGNLALGFPLLETEAVSLPPGITAGPTNTNATATLSLKYSILGNWFVSGTLYYYLDQEQQQAWNPDFTYVFGYSDWRPYTVSLMYANYGGNRFKSTPDQAVTNFDQGTWSLGWKFPITKPFVNLLSFTDEGAIGCQTNYNFTKEYFDLASTSYKANHQTLSLGCKYAIVGNWYVNATAFYYFDSEQKQPWNPDFTYGFGYFDWHPGTVTLQYNNYSGNRWNSSDRAEATGRFIDGSISISYSFSF